MAFKIRMGLPAMKALWKDLSSRKLQATLDKDDRPVPLIGTKNVWCFTALLRGHLALINFVLTRR